MKDPRVTIVLPVLDGGKDVLLSVQSLVAQSFEDWELLVIDDGSTDGTPDAIGHLTDPRIQLIADAGRRGVAARLNQGVDLARAPLIARMDHDDFAHPDRLRAQVEFLSKRPDVDLVGARCVTMDEDGRVFGELPFAETHEAICRRPWLGLHLAHPTWMGRTSWFRRHRYAVPAPYACEDQELLLRALPHSRYHALPDALLAYRVRNTVPSKKLARTRRALLNVQRQHFLSTGQPAQAALSTLAYGARSFSDALRALAPRARSDMRKGDAAELEGWQALIEAAEASAS